MLLHRIYLVVQVVDNFKTQTVLKWFASKPCIPYSGEFCRMLSKGVSLMKRIIGISLNILPFFVWMGWFYCALHHFTIDLGIIQILLLLAFPLLYTILNIIIANDKKQFLIYNSFFGISQIVGYYISGLLYYDYISSDSETILVVNTFTGISIVYILIATMVFYGVRVIIDRVRKK